MRGRSAAATALRRGLSGPRRSPPRRREATRPRSGAVPPRRSAATGPRSDRGGPGRRYSVFTGGLYSARRPGRCPPHPRGGPVRRPRAVTRAVTREGPRERAPRNARGRTRAPGTGVCGELRPPTRPVLKHGPRSLTRARVRGSPSSTPRGAVKAEAGPAPAQVGSRRPQAAGGAHRRPVLSRAVGQVERERAR